MGTGVYQYRFLVDGKTCATRTLVVTELTRSFDEGDHFGKIYDFPHFVSRKAPEQPITQGRWASRSF